MRDPGKDPNQLRMFMTPKEIHGIVNESYDRHFPDKSRTGQMETLDEMWERKLEESRVPRDPQKHGSGSYSLLSKAGWDWDFKVPIQMHESTVRLTNAHHRIAAMLDIDPDALIPVTHRLVPDGPRWETSTKGAWPTARREAYIQRKGEN